MMFQFYYLFSQQNTYIDDIGLKPCCIAFGNVRFFFVREDLGKVENPQNQTSVVLILMHCF
jgi:hypothetical protein